MEAEQRTMRAGAEGQCHAAYRSTRFRSDCGDYEYAKLRAAAARFAHYSTDGRTSSSTGTDGDEFQTSVVWKGESLAFSIEEHEDGRVIHSRETWMLIENGSALQIDRVILDASAEGRQEQTLIYVRQAPDVNGR
jgi:hypothetical protein